MPYNPDSVLKSLSYDDYEEAELLAQINHLYKEAQRRMTMPAGMREKGLSISGMKKDETELKEKLIKKLGYDPVAGRKPRTRGRVRKDALPSPLPEPGTELQSCLGDTYVVQGYAYGPRSGSTPSVALYLFGKALIARSLANLFVGTLQSGEPVVTWPTDPRQLKPGVEVPLGKRRTLTKRDLLDDRMERDEDMKQYEQGRHRRY
jgi:hypothetical protein